MSAWTSRSIEPGRYTLKRDGVEVIEISTTGCDRLPGLIQHITAAVARFYGDQHDDPYRTSATKARSGC